MKAVRAAMAMQEKVRETSTRRAARGEPVCRMGIGVHCGMVLHGFIGGSKRLEFTVIGHDVNLTSRFCDGAAGGEVVLSPRIHDRVSGAVDAEQIEVNTKHEGVLEAWRVTALRA
jgi:adenylate cyclase